MASIGFMNTTPISLLERLRESLDQDAWRQFVLLYTPLLYHWTLRMGLKGDDAADFVQDIFVLLVQKLPEFRYQEQKSFRSWLRTVTLNRLRENQRRCKRLPTNGTENDFADLVENDYLALFEEAEHRRLLVNRALQLMQSDFQASTWQACWELVVRDRSAGEVAAELGISEGAVYVAKHRVLQRLREELGGLLE